MRTNPSHRRRAQPATWWILHSFDVLAPGVHEQKEIVEAVVIAFDTDAPISQYLYGLRTRLGRVQPDDVGTDEFIALCRLVPSMNAS